MGLFKSKAKKNREKLAKQRAAARMAAEKQAAGSGESEIAEITAEKKKSLFGKNRKKYEITAESEEYMDVKLYRVRVCGLSEK